MQGGLVALQCSGDKSLLDKRARHVVVGIRECRLQPQRTLHMAKDSLLLIDRLFNSQFTNGVHKEERLDNAVLQLSEHLQAPMA